MSKRTSEADVYSKILNLQKEIWELRLNFFKQNDSKISSFKPVSLKGIWKGIVVEESDINEAKKSLFPHV